MHDFHLSLFLALVKILTPGNITGWKGKFVLRTAPPSASNAAQGSAVTASTRASPVWVYFALCCILITAIDMFSISHGSLRPRAPVPESLQQPAVHSPKARPWHWHARHVARVCGPLSSSQVLTVHTWVLTPETFRTLHGSSVTLCLDFIWSLGEE